MDVDARPLAGRCECGKVRYRVADAFAYALNCHCSNCRAATGSAFKAFARIEREKLEVTEDRDTLLVSKAPWFEIADDHPQFDELPQ